MCQILFSSLLRKLAGQLLGLNEIMHVNALPNRSCQFFLDVTLYLIYWERETKIKEDACKTTSPFLIPPKGTLTKHRLFQFLELPLFFFCTSVQKRCYCQNILAKMLVILNKHHQLKPQQAQRVQQGSTVTHPLALFSTDLQSQTVQWVCPTHTPFTEVI